MYLHKRVLLQVHFINVEMYVRYDLYMDLSDKLSKVKKGSVLRREQKLTRWGRDKFAAISQTFSSYFL